MELWFDGRVPETSNEVPTPHRQNRGSPFRSKLIPFAAEIGRWQRENKSYREIAALLKQKHGLEVHHETIWSFVTVRERANRRKRRILPEAYMQAPPLTTAIPIKGPNSVIYHASASLRDNPVMMDETLSSAKPAIQADDPTQLHRDMHGRPITANGATNLADL